MYKFILRKDISKFQVLRENLNARKNDDIELRGRKMLKLLFCTTQLVYHTAFEKANHKCIVKMMFLIGSRTLKSVFGLYQAVYNRDSMRFMPPVSFSYLHFKIVSNLNQMFQITETCGLTDRSINDDSNSYDILRKIIESKDVDLAQRWCVYRNLPHEDNPDLEVRAFFFHSP